MPTSITPYRIFLRVDIYPLFPVFTENRIYSLGGGHCIPSSSKFDWSYLFVLGNKPLLFLHLLICTHMMSRHQPVVSKPTASSSKLPCLYYYHFLPLPRHCSLIMHFVAQHRELLQMFFHAVRPFFLAPVLSLC